MKQEPTVGIPFSPAADPLGHTAPLHERARFPLLGVPLELRSNSPAVIAAAERSFGRWRAQEPALIEPIDPLIVSIVVHAEPGAGQAQFKTQNSYRRKILRLFLITHNCQEEARNDG